MLSLSSALLAKPSRLLVLSLLTGCTHVSSTSGIEQDGSGVLRPSDFALLQADAGIVQAPEVVTASDGVKLSYRRYRPEKPRAALLFYHGAGANSATGYEHLGHGLASEFDIAVYLPDLRGHGDSGGIRGDSPSPTQLWVDVTTLLAVVRADYPGIPVFLGGHSSGAGLVLNYTSHQSVRDIEGYVFIAPVFGFRSKTERASKNPFSEVRVALFVANAMSGGRRSGHSYAVHFHYPAEVLASTPSLVTDYTVNMANGVTPSSPAGQMSALERPFGLWVGDEDVLLSPNAVVSFADHARKVRSRSLVRVVPHQGHLSILLNAHQLVGPWLTRTK